MCDEDTYYDFSKLEISLKAKIEVQTKPKKLRITPNKSTHLNHPKHTYDPGLFDVPSEFQNES